MSTIIVHTHAELPDGWPTVPHTLTGYRVNLTPLSAICSILSTAHNEFWSIWTSILPLATFVFLFCSVRPTTPEILGVFLACIASQLCSAVYHVFHCVSPRATRALYNLDLAGVCCMAFGSPWLYAHAYGAASAFYLAALFGLMSACLLMLLRATLRNELAGCERWIAALHRPSTRATPGMVAVCLGYILFQRLRFPECVLRAGVADGRPWHSHVLWHCAVFAGQLHFVHSCALFP